MGIVREDFIDDFRRFADNKIHPLVSPDNWHIYSRLIDFIDELDELLEEQESVKAVADGEDSYMCNNCGTVIGWTEWEPGGIEEVKYKFCPECGRPVKWDD